MSFAATSFNNVRLTRMLWMMRNFHDDDHDEDDHASHADEEDHDEDHHEEGAAEDHHDEGAAEAAEQPAVL